jgi:hypothetical protein
MIDSFGPAPDFGPGSPFAAWQSGRRGPFPESQQVKTLEDFHFDEAPITGSAEIVTLMRIMYTTKAPGRPGFVPRVPCSK